MLYQFVKIIIQVYNACVHERIYIRYCMHGGLAKVILFGSLEGESPQGFLRAQNPKLS